VGGGDCTLSLAWEDATMMPLQYALFIDSAKFGRRIRVRLFY
jgi:hypothetical protein